jgi:hypothetical protein
MTLSTILQHSACDLEDIGGPACAARYYTAMRRVAGVRADLPVFTPGELDLISLALRDYETVLRTSPIVTGDARISRIAMCERLRAEISGCAAVRTVRKTREDANRESCHWLGGDPCYHDGTSLWALEYVMPLFMQGGSDAVWPVLERRYRECFEGME